MSTEDVIRSMRTRMPWEVARRVFKANELPRSQGWPRTLTKASSDEAIYARKDNDLRDALEEHILCGEKIVRLFHLALNDLSRIRKIIREINVPDSAYKSVFPVLLEEADLRSGLPAGLTLVSVKEFAHGTSAILASTRYLSTRENLSPGDFTDEAAAELREYSELIGIKHQRLEALDVLWLPNEGNIAEIRVDYPRGMHQRHASLALEHAENAFSTLLSENIFSSRVNLFPVIESLYQAKGDGAMVELAFMTSGAAQKQEKMRRDGLCCREEAYHLGGVGALNAPIQPYRASVQWPVLIGPDVTSFPELGLFGNSADTLSAAPFLGEMVIRNCANIIDYSYLLNRVLNYIDVTVYQVESTGGAGEISPSSE